MVSVGDTCWITDRSGESHLYFVITEPDEDSKILLVNMTDVNNISDKSCVLTPSDHQTITKKSVIRYGDPIYTKPAILEQAIRNTRELQLGPSMEDRLVKSIQEGALQSEHFPPQYEHKVKNSLS